MTNTQLSDMIMNAAKGADTPKMETPVCQYCHAHLTTAEWKALCESGDISEVMCDYCANATEPETAAPVNPLEAELARLRAERDALLATRTTAPVAPAPAAPGSKLAGTYPSTATAQDRVLLDAIHATKAKADAKYDVPASFGPALYSYMYQLLSAKYPERPRAQAVINQAIESAVQRLVITRAFGGKHMLFFDAREKAPKPAFQPKPKGAPAAAVQAALAAF